MWKLAAFLLPTGWILPKAACTVEKWFAHCCKDVRDDCTVQHRDGVPKIRRGVSSRTLSLSRGISKVMHNTDGTSSQEERCFAASRLNSFGAPSCKTWTVWIP